MAMGGSGKLETVTNPRDAENLPAILLVGASVRWSAESLRRGLPNSRILGLDWFGDSDTRAACDRVWLLQSPGGGNASIAQQCRGIASVSDAQIVTVGGIQDPTLLAGHAHGSNLIEDGSPNERLTRLHAAVHSTAKEIAHNPLNATKLDRENLVKVPRTFWCEAGVCQPLGTEDSARPTAQLLSELSRPSAGDAGWLWKAPNSTAGLGVRSFKPSASTFGDEARSGWIQQRIFGRPLGLVALANGEATRILGITRSLTRRLSDASGHQTPFVYSGSYGPLHPFARPMIESHCDIPWRHLHALCERVQQTFDIRGLFNLDFIRDQDGGWWLLELNQRPSASCEVIERAAIDNGQLPPGSSLMRMHVDAITRSHRSVPSNNDGLSPKDGLSNNDGFLASWTEPANQSVSAHSTWIKRIVFANRDCRLSGERIREELRSADLDVVLADVPVGIANVRAGDPMLTLLVPIRADNEAKQYRQKKMAATRMRRAIEIIRSSSLA